MVGIVTVVVHRVMRRGLEILVLVILTHDLLLVPVLNILQESTTGVDFERGHSWDLSWDNTFGDEES